MRTPRFSIQLDGEDLTFSASHFITLMTGKKEPFVEPAHTHPFRVTVTIDGPLGSGGLLIDFHQAHRLLKEILAACGGKTFLAARQEGISLSKSPDGSAVICRTAGRTGGQTPETEKTLPAEKVITLDEVNSSAEMIALYLARLFLERLTSAGLLPDSGEKTHLTLSLEEQKGMKAVVTI